jgi:hypothetical protein
MAACTVQVAVAAYAVMMHAMAHRLALDHSSTAQATHAAHMPLLAPSWGQLAATLAMPQPTQPLPPPAGIYEWFNISFDKFGRTPSRWQTHICQSIFADLDAAGQLVEQSMEQLYSEALGKFLADRWAGHMST